MPSPPALLLSNTGCVRTSMLAQLASRLGWEHSPCNTSVDAITALTNCLESDTSQLVVLVTALGTCPADSCWPLLKSLADARRTAPRARQVFVAVLSSTAACDPNLRLHCFAEGASMVTDDARQLSEALTRVERGRPGAPPANSWGQPSNGGELLDCPECGMVGLREDQLHLHGPLYHSRVKHVSCDCPACGRRGGWPLHFHNWHGPPSEREPPDSYTAAFALVVCRHPGGRFLMVNEPPGICEVGQPAYWLPAGRLDRGEGFVAAGARETLEEGGLRVAIIGVLCFSLAHARSTRPCPRVTLLAEPLDPAQPPKSVPCWESSGALWVRAGVVSAMSREAFRASDPKRLFPAVEDGSLVAQPVDTPAFQALERLMERHTSTDNQQLHDKDKAKELLGVWQALKAVYPERMFKSSD